MAEEGRETLVEVQFTVPMLWSRITLKNILCKLKYAMIHTIPRQRPGSLGERPVPVYRELKHKDNSTAQSWEHRIPCFQYYMVQGRGRRANRQTSGQTSRQTNMQTIVLCQVNHSLKNCCERHTILPALNFKLALCLNNVLLPAHSSFTISSVNWSMQR